VLQNNASNDLTVSTNAAAMFTTAITSGGTYAVTVKTQPTNPNQICTVTNGSGTVTTANITNVAVTCVTTPLTVVSTTPANNATNVSRSIVPTLSFSTALNATTLTPSNITLTSAGNASVVSAVTLGSNNKDISLVTASKLLPLTQYTLTVTGGVRGQFGESLANAVTNQFTTSDKIWGTAGLIETTAGGAYFPEIAFDTNGNALAVWFQSDGTRDNIWSNRYTVGTGWGTATLIETDNAGSAAFPQIAVDVNGNALAVWQQVDGGGGNINSIWSNRYTLGSGWGTAMLIETDARPATNPQIAFDANGNALAVWVQFDRSIFHIASNRYTAGNGWGTATLVETDDAGGAYDPQIAIDASGNALAVWSKYDGAHYRVWSNRYAAGSGWGTATLIETGAGDALYPQIKMDASGNALAVWQQDNGTHTNIVSNRYTVGSGWGTAMLIETDDAGNAVYPQVAMDANGNAFAIWRQSDGTINNIWSNRYSVGSGWGTATLVETDAGNTYDRPQIAMDASGNALAVWIQDYSIRTYIVSNRYTVGSGWGTATPIESDTGGIEDPQVAVDASGNALAIWSKGNNIVSNRFE